jgi:hypothetical protein
MVLCRKVLPEGDKATFPVTSESLGRQAAVRTPSVSTAKSDDAMGGKLDYLISVEHVKVFKPHPDITRQPREIQHHRHCRT